MTTILIVPDQGWSMVWKKWQEHYIPTSSRSNGSEPDKQGIQWDCDSDSARRSVDTARNINGVRPSNAGVAWHDSADVTPGERTVAYQRNRLRCVFPGPIVLRALARALRDPLADPAAADFARSRSRGVARGRRGQLSGAAEESIGRALPAGDFKRGSGGHDGGTRLLRGS